MKAVWLMILLALVTGAPDGAAQPAQSSPGVPPAESPRTGESATQKGQSASLSSTESNQERGGKETQPPAAGQANKANQQPAKPEEKQQDKAPTGEPDDPEPATSPAPVSGPRLTALGGPSDVPFPDNASDEIMLLVKIGISVGLISILVNLLVLLRQPRLRRRDSQDSSQVKAEKEVEVHGESLLAMPLPPLDEEQIEPVEPVQSDDPPAPPPPTQVSRLRPVEREEKKPLPPPPGPDEFAQLPHSAIGRTLRQLHAALPDLARRVPDPRQQERFLADLQAPLEARIKRFKEGARLGDNYLKEHWIEQDLIATLNVLAQWLSSAIEERKRGRRGNRLLEEELSHWLYERFAPICRDEGWFAVESILPFTTRFDPKIHYSVGSVALEGAANLVVTIKAIGRRDLRQNFVTHKAEVIVGR